MQGIETFIPTDQKIKYINTLLKVGFDTIDFGSFVSPKAIPQMKDTAEVVEKIEWQSSRSKLLAIVANLKGAEDASGYAGITYLGFPLSLSETFQQRNTNKSITEALTVLEGIQNICVKKGKTLVTYLSMGFGNPYNDPYDVQFVAKFVDILNTLDVKIISLADTIGVSTRENITYLFTALTRQYPHIEFGAHLHSNPLSAYEKIDAAIKAGCRRFDGALRGFGGCPMAKDELVGNIATETILKCVHDNGEKTSIDSVLFGQALVESQKYF